MDAARYHERRSKLAAIVSSGGLTRFICISCISLGSLNNCPYSFGYGVKSKRFDIFNGSDVTDVAQSSSKISLQLILQLVKVVFQDFLTAVFVRPKSERDVNRILVDYMHHSYLRNRTKSSVFLLLFPIV